MTDLRFRILAALLAVACVLPSVAAAEEDPLAHRRAEAERKAALHDGFAKALQAATPNQALYDVIHYDLDLDLDPTPQILSGVVTVTARALDALSTLDLDLAAGMAVSAVSSGGSATTWSRAGDVLTVDLDRAYAADETVSVEVTYAGDPSGDGFGWDSYAGLDMIWTLSEPFGAREWWPCKDLNTDKADSLDIRVTVPDHLIVASNGLLVSDVDHGATRTFHWRTGYPTATYLVSLAIHPYSVFSHWYTPVGGGDPMEVPHYVFTSVYDDVQANFGLTAPMIGVFAQGFGEYPFVEEKYGHAMFTWGGGMEHQTISSMGGWSVDLISHELAHQWWGDMITCADFGHIWLNEGFATWSEAYYREQTAGVELYRDYMDLAAFYGPGTIFVEDTSDFWGIFDSNLSYNKASWVVHMLRGVVGDAAFFAGLADYRAQYEYGSATTEQFRDVMEAASGLDLDAFFQQWIYGESFPSYAYDWSADGGQVTVTIDQEQTQTGLFEMPVVLRVTTDLGDTDFSVPVTLASETFVLGPVAGTVSDVALDPDGWILCQVRTSLENPSFDAGVLLVNGVHWGTYGSDLTEAYVDSVFTGDHSFDFWDVFDAPAGGYVAELPAPLGHGAVPPGELGRYSAVVWVGNNYQGDLPRWQETPILSYLEAGGNVLLMTRMASSFVSGTLQDRMGLTWTDTGVQIDVINRTTLDMVSMPLAGTQTWCDVFDTSALPARTDLLFVDDNGFGGALGVGAHTTPETAPTHRADGGRLVLIGARPYRLQHAALRANTQTILDDYFAEPYDPLTSAPGVAIPARPVLSPNRPNPFNPRTVIPFALPATARAELAVYDAAGRLVRTLVDGELPAGGHEAVWLGRSDRGRAVASGTYFVRLRTREGVETRAVTLVR